MVMRALSGIAAVLALGITACSESGDGGGDNDNPPDGSTSARQQFLTSVVDSAILPSLAALVTETAKLRDATAAWSSAPTDAAALAAAREAFVTASAALQRTELMQMGPGGSADSFLGGEGIREELYSWPVVSACRVDQETVKNEFAAPDFFTTRLTNVYGLDALEYLLYVEGEDNACPASQTINASGSWRMMVQTAGTLVQRRAAYAAVVSAQLASDAERLDQAWRQSFAAEVKDAGEDSSRFGSTQDAIDSLFAAIFYLERAVKDTKLGSPMGITAACMTSSCPDIVESRHAGLSLEWVRANLEGFELVFLGGATAEAGFGFDDLLVDAGFDTLATTMRDELVAAKAAANDASGPMQDTLEVPSTRAVHTSVDALARNLKTQFVSALALRVPNEGAADND